MRLRLSLSARALLLLAFNLLLLGLLFFAAGGWGLLLSQPARERLGALSEDVMESLSQQPRSAWPEILAAYSRAHGVTFSTDGPKPPPGGGPPGGEKFGPRAPGPPPGMGPPPAGMPHGPGPNRGGAFDRIDLRDRGMWGPYRLFVPGSIDTPEGRRPLDLIVTADSLPRLAAFLGVGEWLRMGGVAIALSLLLWVPFMFGVARAIARLRTATQRIAAGQLDVRVAATRGDEVGELAASVNHMAAQLENYVAGQKQFLADVAHETISPLARIQVGLGLLESKIEADQADLLRDIQDDARQMSELLHELLLFSRAGVQAQRSPLEAVHLRKLVNEALDQENLKARVLVDDALIVLAHASLLLRALCNLVRNAARHGGGELELAATRAGDRACLWVRDRGPGVPESSLAQLGQPFFRTDSSRSRDSGGYGLGLAIVRRCVAACEGEVEFRNREGGGFEVVLKLRPCAA
jgi:two-component system sensor histidine kinase CpxA